MYRLTCSRPGAGEYTVPVSVYLILNVKIMLRFYKIGPEGGVEPAMG